MTATSASRQLGPRNTRHQSGEERLKPVRPTHPRRACGSVDVNRWSAFPIARSQTFAASSFRGLSTRAALSVKRKRRAATTCRKPSGKQPFAADAKFQCHLGQCGHLKSSRRKPHRDRGYRTKIDCVPQTLSGWVKQDEKESGMRDGITTGERERIKTLKRELRELSQANEILCKASAYSAQAEFDRPLKR